MKLWDVETLDAFDPVEDLWKASNHDMDQVVGAVKDCMKDGRPLKDHLGTYVQRGPDGILYALDHKLSAGEVVLDVLFHDIKEWTAKRLDSDFIPHLLKVVKDENGKTADIRSWPVPEPEGARTH